MQVTVTPESFRFVWFDAAVVHDIAARLVEQLGLHDLELRIEIDETTPLARIRTVSDASVITLSIESGALEDTRRPRHLSASATALAIGRTLLRVRDRSDGTFAEAPDDGSLSLAEVAAWNAYCVGRLHRLGWATNQQRWRYDFRNRHGFDDATDRIFDACWTAERLTWTELRSLSESVRPAASAVPS